MLKATLEPKRFCLLSHIALRWPPAGHNVNSKKKFVFSLYRKPYNIKLSTIFTYIFWSLYFSRTESVPLKRKPEKNTKNTKYKIHKIISKLKNIPRITTSSVLAALPVHLILSYYYSYTILFLFMTKIFIYAHFCCYATL